MDAKIQNQSLMQKTLGVQWDDLPLVLRRHYSADPAATYETGWLTIKYPLWMQWPLSGIRLLGALINRRVNRVPTTVYKDISAAVLYWARCCVFKDGREIQFRSWMVDAGEGQLIEFVNVVMGLRMEVFVEQDCLHYRGVSYVFKLGNYLLNIPNSLALGCATIEERAIDDENYSMLFQLKHPIFGLVYQYSGRFKVVFHGKAERVTPG